MRNYMGLNIATGEYVSVTARRWIGRGPERITLILDDDAYTLVTLAHWVAV